MGLLWAIVLWPVTELVGAVVVWMLGPVWRGVVAPAWRGFVGLLNAPLVLLLWAAAGAGMAAAWQGSPSDDVVALLRIALFIASPLLALAATLAWRRATAPPPRRRSSY